MTDCATSTVSVMLDVQQLRSAWRRCAPTSCWRSARSYDQMLWMGLKKEAAYLPGC